MTGRVLILRKACFLLFVLGWTFSLLVGVSQQDSDKVAQEEEEDYYKKWLNEDVVYLLFDDERAVFKNLTTPEEKDQFIEQFWRRRDWDLTTSNNEYREEHYRRIAYVNQYFGSGIPGWKTDRGRIYIMFGEPAQREYHSGGEQYVRKPYEGGGQTATYPFEIWRYREIPELGQDIEIEFVDRSWTGEFKMALYPWEKDMLMNIDELGQTLSERLKLTNRAQRPGLHPGNLNNTAYMSRHMGQRFEDRPFERLRRYFGLQKPPKIEQKELQTIVDTNISYEMLPFSAVDYHIWIDDRTAFVPVTIEVPNKSLSFSPSGEFMKARVGIYGRVTAMLGEIVYEFEDVVAKEYRPEQLSVGLTMSSLYQKAFSLEPGRYKLELVLKDLTSGNIGTEARSIDLRAPEEGKLSVSSLILASQVKALPEFPEGVESFVIGDVRVVPSMNRKFKTSDEMGVYLQVYNPVLDAATLLPAVSIEYTVQRGNKILSRLTDSEGASIEYFSSSRIVVVRMVNLKLLGKGSYTLTVKLSDHVSKQSVAEQAKFEVVDGSLGK